MPMGTVMAEPPVKFVIDKPVLSILVTDAFPLLLIHALPVLSNAMPAGRLRPPPVKGEPEAMLPLLVSLVTVLLPLFVTHTFPAASIAIAEGAFRLPV